MIQIILLFQKGIREVSEANDCVLFMEFPLDVETRMLTNLSYFKRKAQKEQSGWKPNAVNCGRNVSESLEYVDKCSVLDLRGIKLLRILQRRGDLRILRIILCAVLFRFS